jgi:ligand-binding sensor domain-containing protein/signal transduction histidine kinase
MFGPPGTGTISRPDPQWAAVGGLLLLVGSGCLGGASASPLEYGSRVWQMDDGLPHNCVQAIVQTRDSYIWLGTQEGLARFDGVHFTVFNKANVPAFQNVNILGLLESRDGSLWISTGRGGLVRLYQGKFYHYGKADGLADDSGLGMIFEARDGALWFGMRWGVSRYRDGKFTTFNKQSGFPVNIVRAMCEDAQGRLWFGTPDGVFDWKDGTVTQYITKAEGLRNNEVWALHFDAQGTLWVGAGNTLCSVKDGKVAAYDLRPGPSGNIVTRVLADSQDNLWVGSYGGLYRFVDGTLRRQVEVEGRTFDKVHALLEDRERNIWVGSRDGLVRLKPRRFTSYSDQQGLSCNNIMSVLEGQDGTVWAGTWEGGLHVLKDGTFTQYTNVPLPTKLLGMMEDRRGRLWIGTDWGGGLFRLDHGACKHFNARQGLVNGTVGVIYEDHQGKCWVGTSTNLYLLAGERFHPFGVKQGLSGWPVRAICEDSEGSLWVGTNDGLWRIRKGTFTKFTTADGLSNSTTGAIYADKRGNVWIGTSGGGLNRFRNGRFTVYTIQQGLFSNNIYDILEDDSGWLWLTSSRGIFRVNRHEFDAVDRGAVSAVNSIAYSKADGLASEVCNMVSKPSAWKGRDGRLWFATTRGVSVIDPCSAVKEQRLQAPVVLEQVIADKRPFPAEQTLPLTSPVRIPPGRGELEFHYTALSFGVPERNRFKYMLEGIDPEWVEAGSRRVAYYNYVPPGKYRFRVLARNGDSTWTEAGTSAQIVMLPHLWQTWWFKVLAAVGMLLGTWGLHRFRLAQLRQLEALRLRIATDLHDEVGSNLSAISLLSRKVQKGSTAPSEGREDLAAINRLAARTANSIREIVWFINPEYDTLQDLALHMQEAARTLLVGVDCQFQSSQAHYAAKLPLHLRQDLFLLFKEALTNVAKHSQASQVQIKIAESDHTWQLTVHDNGVGFQTSATSTGNGLKNIRLRAARLGGTVDVQSQPGEGTTILFSTKLP